MVRGRHNTNLMGVFGCLFWYFYFFLTIQVFFFFLSLCLSCSSVSICVSCGFPLAHISLLLLSLFHTTQLCFCFMSASYLFFLRCLFIFLWDRARKSIHLERWEQGSISEELGRDTVIRIYWIKQSIFHKIKVKKKLNRGISEIQVTLRCLRPMWMTWHPVSIKQNEMKCKKIVNKQITRNIYYLIFADFPWEMLVSAETMIPTQQVQWLLLCLY